MDGATFPQTYIKYSLDFLRPIIPKEHGGKQAGRSSFVILLKSTSAILAAATFVEDRTTASTSQAGAVAVNVPDLSRVVLDVSSAESRC